MNQTQLDESTLIAWLNDLLQLDHDAVAAYNVALKELDSPQLRSELAVNLSDHERHISELERHIAELGGLAMPMPHVSGAFKLAVQGAVAAASDRTVLLAFKANELQTRDKYARAARHDMPPEMLNTIKRAAADERRHYDWAVQALEAMGATEADADVKFTKGFAQVHGKTADAMEAVERGGMNLFEKTRRAVKNDPVRTIVTSGFALIGAGVLLSRLARK